VPSAPDDAKVDPGRTRGGTFKGGSRKVLAGQLRSIVQSDPEARDLPEAGWGVMFSEAHRRPHDAGVVRMTTIGPPALWPARSDLHVFAKAGMSGELSGTVSVQREMEIGRSLLSEYIAISDSRKFT
jgi:hypothetical protein